MVNHDQVIPLVRGVVMQMLRRHGLGTRKHYVHLIEAMLTGWVLSVRGGTAKLCKYAYRGQRYLYWDFAVSIRLGAILGLIRTRGESLWASGALCFFILRPGTQEGLVNGLLS